MKQKNVYFEQTPVELPPFLIWFFALFFFINNVKAQDLTGNCFKNSFGSHALITKHNTKEGNFEGFYKSSTGSSGVYRIIGTTSGNPVSQKSFPVTFTIGWGTIKGEADDGSRYWSSSMSGSYDPIQKELNLLNVISAPGQFDAVSIFNPGNLPQSQLFTTVSQNECNAFKDTTILIPLDKKDEDIDYETLLKGNWTVDSKNSYGLVTSINITNMEAKGGLTYKFLRYYKVEGNFRLSSTKEEVSFEGIASPHLPKKNKTDFPFAISLVGTVASKNGAPYNISLSGFSSGDGSKSLNMFLTKSSGMKSNTPEIDDNQISTEEIFIKTK